MRVGLDSATPPTVAQAEAAKAAGVALWGGYLATRPGVGLLHPWNQLDFAAVKALPAMPLAFCSGADDPVALRNLAAAWSVRLCLDVENGIRSNGLWVQAWLDASGAGLYGNAPVHSGRRAAFHILAAYPGYDPGATWSPAVPRPSGPCGWQFRGTHQEFGVGVDRGWYDDWFLGSANVIAGSEVRVPQAPQEEPMHQSLKDTIVRLAFFSRGGAEPSSIGERDFWAQQIKDDGSNVEDIYVKIVTNPGGPEYRTALAKAISGAGAAPAAVDLSGLAKAVHEHQVTGTAK